MPQNYIPTIPKLSGEIVDSVHKTSWIFINSNITLNYIHEVINSQETITIKINNLIEIPSITRDYVTSFTLDGEKFLVVPPTKLQTQFRLFRNGFDVLTNEPYNFTKEGLIKSKVLEVLSCVLVVGIPFVLYKEAVIKNTESMITIFNDKRMNPCGIEEQQPPQIIISDAGDQQPVAMLDPQQQQLQQQMIDEATQLQLQQIQLQQLELQKQIEAQSVNIPNISSSSFESLQAQFSPPKFQTFQQFQQEQKKLGQSQGIPINGKPDYVETSNYGFYNSVK